MDVSVFYAYQTTARGYGASPVVGCALYNDITHFWALTPTAFRAVLKMAGFQAADFRDDAVASLQNLAWLKTPFVRLAQWFLRVLIRTATRENPECLSASMLPLRDQVA